MPDTAIYSTTFGSPYVDGDLVGQQNWAAEATFNDHLIVSSGKLLFDPANPPDGATRSAQQTAGIASLDLTQPYAIEFTHDVTKIDDSGSHLEILLGLKTPTVTNRLTVSITRSPGDLTKNLAHLHLRLPGGDVIDTVPFPLSASGSHVVRAEVNATAVKLLVDGVRIFNLTAPALSSTIASKTLQVFMQGDGNAGGDLSHITSVRVLQPFVTADLWTYFTVGTGQSAPFDTLQNALTTGIATATGYIALQLLGGQNHDPGTISWDLGTYSFSKLRVLPASSWVANATSNANARIINILSFSDPSGTAVANEVEIAGLQFGDGTTNGRTALSASASGGAFLLGSLHDCIAYDGQANSSTKTLFTFGNNNGSQFTGYNLMAVSPGANTGTRFGIGATQPAGTSGSLTLWHCSVINSNMTHGISARNVGTLTLDMQNCVSVGASTAAYSGTTSTLISASTISGNRFGTVSAGSPATASTDTVLGLLTTDIFINSGANFAIKTNANTLVVSTTSPVNLDINGFHRPQHDLWFGLGGKVYVGAECARPIAPLSLAGTAGNASASLSWSASTDPSAASYNVYQDGVKVATGIAATSKTINGLTNGTTYGFTVSAVDGNGNEGPQSQSGAVSVTPAAAAGGTVGAGSRTAVLMALGVLS